MMDKFCKILYFLSIWSLNFSFGDLVLIEN
jgi:hypothetical protein